MIWRGFLSSSLKIVLLGVLDVISIWTAVSLFSQGNYAFLAALVIGVGLINYLSLSQKAYPFRYLFPGLVFLAAMVVYPLFYTVYISTTNLSTGHLLTKQQVIEQFESRYFQPPDPQSFRFWTYQNDQGDLKVILSSEDGRTFISQQDHLQAIDLSDPRFERSADGTVERFDDYRRLTLRELYQNLSTLEKMELRHEDKLVRLANLRPGEFRTYNKQYRYVAEEDQLIDLQTGMVYHPEEGYFTVEDGTRLEPGFRTFIGLGNFTQLATNTRYRQPFLRVFIWTIVWALGSVVFSFALGLGLAWLLNDPQIRFRFLYRSLLIIPYAIPVFISALVWRGMFHADVGVINRVLQDLVGLKIPWLLDPLWAKVTLIFINVWLTYPYMMIITLGALQSIPQELYEAAWVDGASTWQRFSKITMPLLMITVAPLLIGSFAFTFNNFTIIWLVTAGRPAVPGAEIPAGATDILISLTYRIAFEGQRGNNWALASALSIIIFIIIATISAINFRYTRALEEVSEGV
ncbi:MAG: maltose ABC transporter permease MalF [Candidatus Bipolaricaulia bacterium]